MEISARRASGDDAHGTIRARTFVLPGGFRLLVGRDPRGRADFEDLILESLGGALGITLVLGLLGGLVISRRMLRRVDAVRETGQRIVRGDLSRRMPVTGVGDEFDRLSITVNEMLDEIETLMTGLRTVTDSVAHDLRSPLTRLKSRLELALREGPADEQGHRAALERAIAETDGILRTFATLMEIARAESGKAGIALEPVDLRAIVADMVELYAPLAEEKGLAIEAALEEAGSVAGHGQFLSQLVANLLDNALAYTHEGRIRVSLAHGDSGAVRLTVEDSGPGIPPEERERVLQRFVRLDASRTGGGSGLGLSLVAGVATLHRAELALVESPLGGLRVSVTFPPVAS
ncbi:MAG: HAMP domain-containing sensor histidine kinase [Rhodospirillaceae bacterium]|nr:HAMP domain-containing sensor histidine kinase [Rhodospirillaceae bacterium]